MVAVSVVPILLALSVVSQTCETGPFRNKAEVQVRFW